jgi:MFS-type transporter involved in bile tolerance (Atg22 family)
VLLVLLPLIVRIVRGRHSRTLSTAGVGADNLDVWLIRLCPLVEMFGFLSLANAQTTIQYYASGALTALGAFGSPTLHSALTKHVAKEEVGRLLGALSLLGSLSRIVSPLVLNLLYSFTVATFPQAIFYFLSGIMFIGFVLSWGVKAHGNNPYIGHADG